MARNIDPKCKQCRREGMKLFLKGERCYSGKCPMIKRNYPPGVHGPKGKPRQTDYALQLRTKQRAKRLYGLLEKQFKNYFKAAQASKGDTSELLAQLLEMRLDNVVYRLGFSKSRQTARQLVNHGHFLVNNKKISIPSYQVKVGEVIDVRETSRSAKPFVELPEILKKQEVPLWLSLNKETLTGKVTGKPTKDMLPGEVNLTPIIEYYSR